MLDCPAEHSKELAVTALLTRREILGWGLTATLSCLGNVRRVSAEPPGVPIVDTHTHFYDPTRPQGVPWPAKTDTFLYRPVLPAEYRALAEPLGVVGTVVVEASPWLHDNDWVLELAQNEPFLLGLVGHLVPGSEEFRQHFPRLSRQPKFLGIRVNSTALAQGLEQPAYLADLKQLAAAGKALDVNGRPDLLPLVVRLAEKLPDLRIVINHLANVRIEGDKLDAEWLAGLRAAARHPQVVCKVSALVEGAAQGGREPRHDVAYYRPVLDAVWDAFGDERVVYGSNWPVSARYARYAVVQQIVQDYVANRGRAPMEKFFRHNAERVYRWPAG